MLNPKYNEPIISVLDRSFNAVATLDAYSSFNWTERYAAAGEFDIELALTNRLLDVVKQRYYLTIPDSEYMMIIEDFDSTISSIEGSMTKITGRSLESILDIRIITKNVKIKGSLQNGIKQLINENIIAPEDPARRIDNFVFIDSTDPYVLATTATGEYFTTSLLSTIKELCDTKNIGFKLIYNFDLKRFEFSLYYSTDRSYNQVSNPYVVFSPAYDNLLNLEYLNSSKSFKSVMIVGGEGEKDSKKLTIVASDRGAGSGLDRIEGYLEGETNVDAELDPYPDLTPEEKLIQQGKEELVKQNYIETFQGDIDATQTYVYNRDFFIGDIVQLDNLEFDIRGEVRVTETVRTYDAEGYSVVPTFVSIDQDAISTGDKLRLSGIYVTDEQFSHNFATELDMRNFINRNKEKIYSLNAEAPKSQLKDTIDLFNGLINCRVLNIAMLNTDEVTDMTRMFHNLAVLEELDLTNMDFNACLNMEDFASNCPKLKRIIWPSAGTGLVTNMNRLMKGNISLTEFVVPTLNTISLISAEEAFASTGIKELDLSKCKFNALTHTTNMFADSTSLTIGWARTDADRDILNASTNIPVENLFQTKPSPIKVVYATETSYPDYIEEPFFTTTEFDTWLPTIRETAVGIRLFTGDVSEVQITSLTESFRDFTKLLLIDFTGADLSELYSMESMCTGCTLLVSAIFGPKNNTVKLQYMNFAFKDCPALLAIDLSPLDTSLVQTMDSLFHNDTSLETINTTGLNMSTVFDLSWFAYNCTSLKNIDLSTNKLRANNVLDNMWVNCNAVTTAYAFDQIDADRLNRENNPDNITFVVKP